MSTPTAKELFLAEVSTMGLPKNHLEVWAQCEAMANDLRECVKPPEPPPVPEEILALNVWDIGLSGCTSGALLDANIETVRDVLALLAKGDGYLLKLRDFGVKSLRDVKNTLVRIGAIQLGEVK